MTDIGRGQQAYLISHEHDWMMERLQSLENCLDNIFYYGEVCADMRGFGGLLRRCRELRNMLTEHVQEEEKLFERLSAEKDLKPLLERLKAEHKMIMETLEESVVALEAVEAGKPLTEDLHVLQDKVRRLSSFLQHHIATENLYVFPRLAGAA